MVIKGGGSSSTRSERQLAQSLVVESRTARVVAGGAVTTGGGGVWPGQMRNLWPEGSIRGPCQLAHPGASNAQAAITSAHWGVRHFLREVINWPSVFAVANSVAALERRRSVKLYRLEKAMLPFGNEVC